MKTLTKIVSAVLIISMFLGYAVPSVSAEGGSYSDVHESDWFYNYVEWVSKEGIMNGVGANKFDPKGTTTRAMIATIFWRLEGAPKPAAPSGFSDVPDGMWYADAIAWLKDKNITNGSGPTTFSPNDPVTREELATFLYRFAKYQGRDLSLVGFVLGMFEDGPQVSPWAADAVCWAKGADIMSGDGTMFMPKNKGTRCEIAAIIQRYLAPIYSGVKEIKITKILEEDVLNDYYAGENLPKIEVTAYMKDGSSRILEGDEYAVAPVDLEKPGKTTIRVQHLAYFVDTYELNIKAWPAFQEYDIAAAREYAISLLEASGAIINPSLTPETSLISYSFPDQVLREISDNRGGQFFLLRAIKEYTLDYINLLNGMDAGNWDFESTELNCYIVYDAEWNRYLVYILWSSCTTF